MTRFVLVPGACHGGWNLEPLAAQIRAAGHTATAVTLEGLDGVVTRPVNLETHVEQVAALVADEPAVLVGHSYAGSILTVVGDRWPDRVLAMLYVDAFVPRDGESCWAMTNDEQRAWYVAGCGATGLGVEPLPFFDARAVAQPVGTFLQVARLTDGGNVRVKHYVAATCWGAGESPFVATAARLRADPAWVVHDVPVGHNVMTHAPDELLRLALALA